jgi:hypothetical protein
VLTHLGSSFDYVFTLKKQRKNYSQRKCEIFLEGQFQKKLVVKDFFKKEDVSQKKFFEDLGLLIVKNDLLIQFMKSI